MLLVERPACGDETKETLGSGLLCGDDDQLGQLCGVRLRSRDDEAQAAVGRVRGIGDDRLDKLPDEFLRVLVALDELRRTPYGESDHERG